VARIEVKKVEVDNFCKADRPPRCMGVSMSFGKKLENPPPPSLLPRLTRKYSGSDANLRKKGSKWIVAF